MIVHKIGRILNGGPNYADSWHNIAGYAAMPTWWKTDYRRTESRLKRNPVRCWQIPRLKQRATAEGLRRALKARTASARIVLSELVSQNFAWPNTPACTPRVPERRL